MDKGKVRMKTAGFSAWNRACLHYSLFFPLSGIRSAAAAASGRHFLIATICREPKPIQADASRYKPIQAKLKYLKYHESDAA
jgi:hypothetical protein